MSYVVNYRKPKKHKMVAAVKKEMAVIDKQIEELKAARERLWQFKQILVGRDGVEQAGKFYCEDEDALIYVLPHDVIRYYNPHTN